MDKDVEFGAPQGGHRGFRRRDGPSRSSRLRNTRGRRRPEKLILRVQGIGINPPVACAKQTTLLGPVPPVFVSPPRPALASLTSFGPMETSANLYFAGELTPPAKSVLAKTPTTRRSRLRRQLPCARAVTFGGRDSEFSDDLDIEVAGELERQDDGFGTPAPTTKGSGQRGTSTIRPSGSQLRLLCGNRV